ncbi:MULTISPECIES: carbohydrate ABC transporter permease [Clavibacter]|uniref:Transport protein n=1 Tax=Clavibacter tessellarius TaxID=31965 RepID=A0A154V202_9MICO|nr:MULTISPECIES: carbohydrate ABC transporter permease [Clavibacter]KZC95406.1 transport protein [Clavibacter michiganensis subsp. tessellarius]MDA3804840.1 carbohydrate ABC transporter permease [Clavibacter sp. CT19]
MPDAPVRAARPRSVRRPGARRRSRGADLWLALSLAAALVPLAYLLSVSLMSQGQVSAGILVPTDPSWGNWAAALAGSGLPRGILNSLVTSLAASALTLLFALPAAWAMARHRTGGRALAGLVLSPWLLPPIVAIVPVFTLLRILHLNNTLTGLTLVYALANTAVAVWLLEGFVRRIPVELDEAAQLDGAGEWRVLASIVTPMLTPALVSVGVIVAVLDYDEFLFATFLTQGHTAQTFPVVLSLMLGERVQDFGKIAAASLIGVIPLFAAATVLQRRLVAGLTGGSVDAGAHAARRIRRAPAR